MEAMIYDKADEIIEGLVVILSLTVFIYCMTNTINAIAMDHLQLLLNEKKKQTKKQKIATLNLVNGDDKCFQYVATVALNDEKNGKTPEVMLKIKPFNKYIYLERKKLPIRKR